MAITASMVKELREQTGAGMMDCKKALVETDGNLEEAALYLQKKGMSSAAKKAGRTAAEGLAAISRADDLRSATLLEVNCETDFVSRSPDFITFVEQLAALAQRNGLTTVGDLAGASRADGKTVADWTAEQISTIGENIQVRRLVRLDGGSTGMVSGYVHAGAQIAVLVQVNLSGKSPEEAEDFGKDIAMHVAASNPEFVSGAEIDPAYVAKQRAFLIDQAQESGKPADIIEKMVEGRVKKWQREIALLDQPFVKDPDVSVDKHSKNVGGVTVAKFVRYQVGEGIEKRESNLAEEVAAQLKG